MLRILHPSLPLLLLAACTPNSATSTDAATRDARTPENDSDIVSGGPDAGPNARADAGPDESGPELIIEQLSIVGSVSSGESALIIGPDGTSVLIDVGGSAHAARVLEAIDRRIGTRAVDWVIITHYHGDHHGAAKDLFAPGPNQVTVNRGVITRGLHNIGADVTDNGGFKKLCSLHEGATWSGRTFDLCSGPSPAPCDGSATGAPWPASDCSGLLRGDLESSADDNQGRPSFVSLGDGARLIIYHGNGHMVQDGGVISAEEQGIEIGYGEVENENARSLGGILRWGEFGYLFSGDLTGAGDKPVPDIEGFIAEHSSGILDGEAGPPLLARGALDVANLGHHGLKSATQQAWADWLYPDDGHPRNAIVGGSGISTGYSPSSKVLKRLGPRLSSGYVWVTHPGILAGTHERRRDADGAVVVRVSESGSTYQIHALTDAGAQAGETYASAP